LYGILFLETERWYRMKASTVARSMLTAAACLLGATVVASAAVTTYPYTSGFESDTVGQLPSGGVWTKTGDGTTTVSNNTIVAAGTKSCCINDAALTLDVDSASNDKVVRVRLFCKPVAYDTQSGDPTVDAGSRAAFFLTTEGKIRVYTSGGWSELATGFSVDQWYGFLVTLDYDKGLWDLYYTNGQYAVGSGMTRLNVNPLTMATGDANTELTKVTVSSGTSAYVDEFSVDKSYSSLVAGVPSQPAMQYVSSFVIQPGMASREILRYFDSTSDGLLQECGALLLRALNLGDKIHVYFPDIVAPADRWGIYEKKDVAGVVRWVWTSSPSGKDRDQVHLTPNTGMWIETTLSGSVTVSGFAPFITAGSVATSVSGEWTMLSWPWAPRNVNNGTLDNLGFSPRNGDKLFIFRAITQPYLTLTWQTGVGWKAGSGAVSYSISREQGMWFYNSLPGVEKTWNPAQ
jgi:hypothetical protein